MKPKISVIMAIYSENTIQLQNSIDSILGQTFMDFECIIILDNPENHEARIFLEAIVQEEPRIIFRENKRNIKLGASLNRGISLAVGNYIARMDGDDVCDRSKLKKQYEFLEKNKNVDLLFTGWNEVDEKGSTTTRIPCKKDFINIEKTFFYKSPLLHASMMCRREVFESHKYPEIDRPEDFGLFLNLISQKYVFDVLEENLYTFYIQTYDTDKKYTKIRVFSSNFIKILSKNISKYWNNIYFWWMFLLVLFQWILSRNKMIFSFCFNFFQKVYKKVFL